MTLFDDLLYTCGRRDFERPEGLQGRAFGYDFQKPNNGLRFHVVWDNIECCYSEFGNSVECGP